MSCPCNLFLFRCDVVTSPHNFSPCLVIICHQCHKNVTMYVSIQCKLPGPSNSEHLLIYAYTYINYLLYGSCVYCNLHCIKTGSLGIQNFVNSCGHDRIALNFPCTWMIWCSVLRVSMCEQASLRSLCWGPSKAIHHLGFMEVAYSFQQTGISAIPKFKRLKDVCLFSHWGMRRVRRMPTAQNIYIPDDAHR